MTADPAIAAAQRAWDEGGQGHGFQHATEADLMIDAAREALAPLRARHRAAYGFKLPRRKGDRPETFCETCQVKWPCDDARDIYPEDEL